MSAEANKQLIERFYDAFDKHDGDAMAACYTPGARFSDPVFVGLKANEPGAMWRMLTGQAKDLRVELHEHDADESRGSAHWIAHYTFTQTGRPVVNDVRGELPLRGRADRRAHRRLQLPPLVTAGARHARPAARLDSAPASRHSQARPRLARRVPRQAVTRCASAG